MSGKKRELTMRNTVSVANLASAPSPREQDLVAALTQGQTSERALMEMLARMASRRESRVIYSSYPACNSDS
jgi:hypothetical protein